MKHTINPKGNDGGAGEQAAMVLLRRVLDHRISVGALLEAALWLAIPYITVGLLWAVVHPEPVRQLQSELDRVLPAGAEMGGFAEAAAFWPALLLLPDACPR